LLIQQVELINLRNVTLKKANPIIIHKKALTQITVEAFLLPQIFMQKTKHLLAFTLFILTTLHMSAITYTLSFPNPQNHYCHVKMEFTAKSDQPIVGMPVWAPGSYLVREFSKNMEGIQSNFGLKKIQKNQWQLDAKQGEQVEFSYLIYANEVSVRTSFINAEHALISSVGTFTYAKGQENEEHIVNVTPHKNWKKVACGLINPNNKKQVVAANYDLLVDAPIEVGNHDEFTFEAAGVTHTVAMVGKNNADYKRLAKDMKRIIETTIKVWGELPVKRYLFIVENTDHGRGGLEHLNSTVLMMARNDYAKEEKYINFISLVAHEYFHLWNVKRLRPMELGPFDYDVENHTELLWFFEGFTAYYDELLLHRAGFIDETAYLKRVTNNIEGTENRPGVKVQTVAEASYDAWIKAYRPNENSTNTTISYYGKGAIVATLLDLTIVKESECKYNLDDLMQVLYAKYKANPEKGITEQDIFSAANKLAGKDLSSFFNHMVHSTAAIDYPTYFKHAGLEYKSEQDTNKISLGITTKTTEGKIIVNSVQRNTAAYRGGINAGDQLIAISGDSISTLEGAFDGFTMDEIILLDIIRDGITKQLEITLSYNPDQKISLTPQVKSEKKANKARAKWLMKE